MEYSNFIQELAVILEVPPEEMSEDVCINDGRFDSLAAVSTMALIDEYYGVTVDSKMLKRCNTVKDILAIVRHRVEA
ncbi:MAG: acyl carrier protein [Candidatus Sumerlaeia bacterium]|nr:acyl carrier protein [Candidatus Sumerlaeia bacterium]